MRKLPFLTPAVLLLACGPTRDAATTAEPRAPVTVAPSPTLDASPTPTFAVPFEKFELANGLEVVMHVDKSDPVVAVSLAAHVGSAREKPGRTGFAHLFEHLLFLESENLGKGGLDKMSARIGGQGANGFTSRDQTNYFQTVPRDALEKMIWAEADKLGYFINTVSEPVLAKEKEVVKNEKRQSYDNRPYGFTQQVVSSHLYPADHPYHWQVIGSLEDLQNATLADVKEFFRRWYVPNNVTLTIAGDFDPAEARRWVEKYFAEIPRGQPVADLPKQAAGLRQNESLYYEDNFATLPELTMVWPAVEEYHPDAYALQVLAQYLSEGKAAPLYQTIVEGAELAPEVSMYLNASELAGELALSVRAYGDKDLDSVAAVVTETLARFGASGIPQADLERILAGQETQFYNGLSSVLGKAFQLSQYNTFAGDPGFVATDIARILAVTPADVMRVYETYIEGKPFVATSFVPRGQVELALAGATLAVIPEEKIEAGAEDSFDASLQAEYERTPSSFDRSREPEYNGTIATATPEVWEAKLPNGLRVMGIYSDEVPLVNFDLRVDGGQRLESLTKTGVAHLTAALMNKGTARRTPLELEAALDRLGASVNVYATDDAVHVRGNTLARNYDSTMAIVTEMLLEPRWDARELELARKQAASQLQEQAAQPNFIAAHEFAKALYGEGDIRAQNTLGTEASLAAITMADLQNFYRANVAPNVATLHVVGAKSGSDILNSLVPLNRGWTSDAIGEPMMATVPMPDEAKVYFYDVPGAKQSVLRVGYPSLDETDPNFYRAEAMNYILGGGGFASRLTQELREGKGYTYGITSRFSGGDAQGPFVISTGVRSNVTTEAALAIQEILRAYAKTYTPEDLATTQSSLIKGNARAFETAGAKLGLLSDMSEYGYAADYVKAREEVLRSMTVAQMQALAAELLDPDKMVWLVVGDAETQLAGLEKLGYGPAVLISAKP